MDRKEYHDFLYKLINRDRYFSRIDVNLIIDDNLKNKLHKWSYINIIKKHMFYEEPAIKIYIWQLHVIVFYFINNNIEISYENIKIYNEYITEDGSDIDYLIYDKSEPNIGPLNNLKKNNIILSKLKQLN